MEKQILYTCSKTFSKNEYADFFMKGNLRFMPLEYYTKMEGDSREDKYEGVSSFFQPNLSKFIIDGIELNPAEIVGPILFRHAENNAHIFCLSAFYYKSALMTIEEEKDFWERFYKPSKEKLLTFGETTVLISNIVEFLKRIDAAVENLGLIHARKFVTYDALDDFHGDIECPGFIKDLKYKDENEYRLSLKIDSSEMFVLNIGDISDITFKIPTCDIDKISIEIKE